MTFCLLQSLLRNFLEKAVDLEVNSLFWHLFLLLLRLDDYTVRLSGSGSTLKAGRVEIFYGDRWGTICDNSWDMNDATVVCKMLGYESAGDAPRGAYYGQGVGPVWLDEVDCAGSESSLEDCSNGGFGNVACDHVNDASVVCSGDRTGG